MYVEDKGRSKERGRILGGHWKSRGRSKNRRSQSRGRKDCLYYGKLGHLKKDCWSRKKKKGYKQQDDNKESNFISKYDDDSLILFLDNYFLDYVQGDFGLVYLGDNETLTDY